MLNFGEKTVYLACGKTDMRKSINGLVAIVEGSFQLSPFDEALFVFCNRGRDRVKILEWDDRRILAVLQAIGEGSFPLASRGLRNDNDAERRGTKHSFKRYPGGIKAKTERGFRAKIHVEKHLDEGGLIGKKPCNEAVFVI